MIATRIKQRLESDTIRIPDAGQFIGRDVEIIVLVDSSDAAADNPRKSILGSAKGKIWVSPDFDDPLPDEILQEFEK